VEVEEDDFEEPWEESVQEISTQNKYHTAAHIAQQVLRNLLSQCVIGASARQLCRDGDAEVTKLVIPHFTNTKDEEGAPITRGTSYPTTVSVNEIVCNYSPDEPEFDVIMKSGDVVRVEVGCHIDGFIGTGAHTIIVDAAADKVAHPETYARKTRVMTAAWQAAEAVLRLMRPGTTNEEITEHIARIAHSYNVQGVQGSVSHRMARFEEMGDQIIMNATVNNDKDTQLQEEIKIRENSVWNIDIAFITVDTGRGEDNRLRQGAVPTSIYKRTEVLHSVKYKSAHYVLKFLRSRGLAGQFPFASHMMDNIATARFGLAELQSTQLVDLMPTLYCKPAQTVARFKWTVYVHEDRVERVVSGPIPEDLPIGDHTALPEVCKEVLRRPLATDTASAAKAATGKARKKRKMEE
jgi:curved DNA binding protein